MKKRNKVNIFRNDSRIDSIHAAIRSGNRDLLDSVVTDRAMNSQICRKLKGKGVIWEALQDDEVYRLEEPTNNDKCVLKLFDDLPFHEICGNVIATKLIETAGPFYVRCFDVGRFTDSAASYFILMEYVEDDAEDIDLNEPIHMYNLFYQVAYAVHHLSTAFGLQHFDLRYDNIRIKHLPSSKDLFKNQVKSSFIIKIGDWGQCEFNFGENRPINDDIPREEENAAKWGIYPTSYSNYDTQYFLSTLTPVLTNLHGVSYYYIYNMVLDFMQPVSFTTAQDRPIVITERSPLEIIGYLKKYVLPTVQLLPDDKENSTVSEVSTQNG